MYTKYVALRYDDLATPMTFFLNQILFHKKPSFTKENQHDAILIIVKGTPRDVDKKMF